eukprot:469570_1
MSFMENFIRQQEAQKRKDQEERKKTRKDWGLKEGAPVQSGYVQAEAEPVEPVEQVEQVEETYEEEPQETYEEEPQETYDEEPPMDEDY